MAVRAKCAVRVDEVATAIVVVQIDAGEVADDEQIQVVVVVEVDEAARVGPSVALRRQPSGFGRGRKVALAVVEQQVGGMTVVCVVVRGGHLPALIRTLVLS
jgi:hypothetical protein